MSATNYTPIYLYNSGTATNTPSAANLGAGELAINYADGKLFYKDGSAAVQVIAWKTTPTTAGGTGLTSYTAGDLPYYASGSALSKLGIGTSGYVLQSNGSAPTWVAQSTLSVGTATNATNTAITDNTSSSATWYPTIVSATTGNLPQTTSSTKLSFVPSTGTLTATSYGGAWAGSTIGTTYGGTGLTSFTANGVVYASSTSALATSSAFTFNGTDVGFTGNLVPGTSGKGINFSANPNTGTSQLLNDYEEGTFTATLGGFITDPTTPVTSTARYTKIGRQVTCTIGFNNVNTTGGLGATLIRGLPFTPSGIASMNPVQMGGMGTTVGIAYVGLSTTFSIYDAVNNANLSIVPGTGKYLLTTVTYFV
jgi:hypothetical protein